MEIKLNDYNEGEVIRIVREWTGLTQSEFGETVGRSLRTIQDYEHGMIDYPMSMLYKIMKKHNLEIIIRKKR